MTTLCFQENQDLSTIDHNVINAELSDILSEVRKINSNNNNAVLLEKIFDLEGNMAELQSELSDYKLNAAISASGKKSVMTTYIRWGSKTCPGNGAESTYDGFAAGSHYNNYGGASNMLCLTRDPEFGKYDDAVASAGGQVYGTQYRDSLRNAAFEDYPYFHDVPCAVCEVKGRSAMMMIPGRKKCYEGWTREYCGYLMSDNFGHKHSLDYYCIDADQQTLQAGSANVMGNHLYFVEGRCGSLPCPPYVEGRELTCVVCTK